jgi:hypothetical protein
VGEERKHWRHRPLDDHGSQAVAQFLDGDALFKGGDVLSVARSYKEKDEQCGPERHANASHWTSKRKY